MPVMFVLPRALRRRLFSVAFIPLAMLLGACRETTASTITPRQIRAAHRATTLPEDGGTLIRRIDGDVKTLNPVRAADLSERYVANYLFTPLVYLDQNLRPIGGLAISWAPLSPDGLRYRFDLNRHATFSDNTPVKASDVVFTLKKIGDPKSDAGQAAGVLDTIDIDHTRAIGDYTIEIAFKIHTADYLIRLNRLMVIPEHVYSHGNFANDFNTLAVGSGPYRLVPSSSHGTIRLERRADYWGDKPHIQTIVFKVISEDATAWNALRLDQIDETSVSSAMFLRHPQGSPEMHAVNAMRFYTYSYNAIAWNGRSPWFADKRVRRALTMCIPVQEIIQTIYGGTGRSVSGPFAPDNYAYNAAITPPPYDLSAATRLLNAAGWVDTNGDRVLDQAGKPFIFDMLIRKDGTGTSEAVAQTLEQHLKRIGVHMNIRTVDSATFPKLVMNGNYDAAYFALVSGPEPDPYVLFHSSQFAPHGYNFAFYSNPEADRLMEALRVELDKSKRQALFHRLHAILADDVPHAWLMQIQDKWFMQKRVRGVQASAGYGLFRWYPGEFAWWIPREFQGARTH